MSPRAVTKKITATPIIEEDIMAGQGDEEINSRDEAAQTVDKRKESIEAFQLVDQKLQAINANSGVKASAHNEGRKASNTIHVSIQAPSAQAQQSGLKKPSKLPSQNLGAVISLSKQVQISTQQTQIPHPATNNHQKSGHSSQNVAGTHHQHPHQSADQTGIDDDEFIDDMLDDSMELHESNTMATSSMSKSKTSSIVSNPIAKNAIGQLSHNNKVNTTSPSKLNSKFNVGQGKQQTPVIQHRQQQNIKASAISGKKTLASMQQTDKEQTPDSQRQPMAQVDLNLSMGNLQRVPSEQLQNSGIRSLDLRNNKLQTGGLPDQLFRLENLWKLQLDNNQIEVLPDMFAGLSQLRQLTIQSNLVEALPPSLFQVKNLEKLDLTSNKLKDIPNEIGKLSSLKYLYLSDNQITELPKSMGTLKHLQLLALEWCQYLNPVFEKTIKKNIPALNSSNQSTDDSILQQFLSALTACPADSVSFFVFLQSFYNIPSLKQTFQSLQLRKKQSIIHFICRYNHLHLFEKLKEHRCLININLIDENGQTSLMIAQHEKAYVIVEKLLKDFKEQLDLSYKPQCSTDDDSNSDIPVNPKTIHPLMIAVKALQYETALRVLGIMVRQSQGNDQNAPSLNLNIKDEQGNTILHYLFMNFSCNMELSVELCQELLKQYERGLRTIPSITVLKLNETNKQGLTAFDQATEVKQNQAIEFAIYYNKNMLPAFQVKSNQQRRLNHKKEVFDINFNQNPKGMTPIHRAILAQNYKAIYLLLQSGQCNLFIKDKDYKSAREYCQKILFLSKYLRKGESNYLRLFLHNVQKQIIPQTPAASGGQSPDIRSSSSGKSGISGLYKPKNILHGNINFFVMASKKGNRIKYNSWYTRVGAANGSSTERGGANMLLSNSQQPTLEKKEGDEDGDDEPIRIEDLNEEEEDENVNESEMAKASQQVQNSLINSNLSVIDQSENHLQVPKGSSGPKATDKKSNSIIKPQLAQFNDRRLSDQQSKRIPQHKPAPSLKSSGVTTQAAQSLNKPPTILTTPLDKRLKIQQQMMQQQINISSQEFDTKKTSFDIKGKKGSGGPVATAIVEDEETLTEIEGEEAGEESPTSLPSNKYKYVMPVNNSKLARKSYYKQIQRNKFEREFCIMLDTKVPLIVKIQVLYKVFAQVQQLIQNGTKEQSQTGYRDGREFLGFLKLEFDNKDECLLPLRNEILYLQESLFGANNLSFLFNESSNSAAQRKNTNNFSLERGPLPMIQETAENHQISPSKNNSNSSIRQHPPKSLPKTNLLKQMTQTPEILTEEEKHHQQSHRLNTASSQKKLETVPSVQSNKGGQTSQSSLKSQTITSKKPSSHLEDFKQQQQLKLGQIHPGEDVLDQDTNRSPSTTSPRANSGQIISKATQETNIKTLTSNLLGSPITQANQQYLNSQNSLQKAKDACIKKIEVQITEKQQHLNSPGSSQGESKLSTAKWKQLTINPNATAVPQQSNHLQSSPATGIGKGVTQKLANNNAKTPQSSKTASSQSQQINNLLSLANQNTQQQLSGQKPSQPQVQQQIIIQTHQNKTSSSLSNRSNSNPRNSLLTGSTQGTTLKTASIAKASIPTTQSALFKPQISSQTQVKVAVSVNQAVTTSSTTNQSQNSSSKPKTQPLTKPSNNTSTISRNTIGSKSVNKK